MGRRFESVLRIFLATCTTWVGAQDDPGVNFREQCRRSVSGTFANSIADTYQADDNVILAKQMIVKSQKMIDATDHDLKAINHKLESVSVSPDLISDRDAKLSELKLYQEQLQSASKQLGKAQRDQELKHKTYESLKNKISKIFKIQMAEDPEGGPRPLFHRLEWKSTCPTYRSLCPLPKNQIENLLDLLANVDDNHNACDRYTKIK